MGERAHSAPECNVEIASSRPCSNISHERPDRPDSLLFTEEYAERGTVPPSPHMTGSRGALAHPPQLHPYVINFTTPLDLLGATDEDAPHTMLWQPKAE